MNDQRKAVFEQRIDFMLSDDVADVIKDMRQSTAEDLVTAHIPPKAYADQWDTEGLYAQAIQVLGVDVPVMKWADEEGVDDSDIRAVGCQTAGNAPTLNAGAAGHNSDFAGQVEQIGEVFFLIQDSLGLSYEIVRLSCREVLTVIFGLAQRRPGRFMYGKRPVEEVPSSSVGNENV